MFAGGDFTTAGGMPASRIARWNGSNWSTLGSGIYGNVSALAVFDEGGGPRLYAGGSFTAAGGSPASRVAAWNGASWAALGAGISGGSAPWGHALVAYDRGNGPAPGG